MTAQIFRPGATAVITGGASGVGFAMANFCRSEGMHLCLLDRNEDALSAAKATLETNSNATAAGHQLGLKTKTYTLDVGDLESWNRLKPEIVAEFPAIDVLLLNAGTSLQATTAQSYEDVSYFQQTLATNMFGVINGLATLLPAVQATAAKAAAGTAETKESKQAIIITGSKQGITNPPGAANPAYNMSKSALKTLAEHLSHDLRTPGNLSYYSPNISVHLLIPGWTFTGLSGNPGPVPVASVLAKKPAGAWTAAQVTSYAVKKIEQGTFYIVCPDGDVDEALDEARMTYAAADVVEGRPPLSRWHDDFKDDAAAWIAAEAEKRRALKE